MYNGMMVQGCKWIWDTDKLIKRLNFLTIKRLWIRNLEKDLTRELWDQDEISSRMVLLY